MTQTIVYYVRAGQAYPERANHGRSKLFRFAADILQDCESHTGATARSKFALAGCLRGTGDFEEAETVMGEVQDSLIRIGHAAVDASEVNEDFLEQFTLYCHR